MVVGKPMPTPQKKSSLTRVPTPDYSETPTSPVLRRIREAALRLWLAGRHSHGLRGLKKSEG